MTEGQRIVRVDFSRDGEIQELKKQFADLIDKVRSISIELPSNIDESTLASKRDELFRLVDQSVNYLEIAAMYAVKAATIPEP